MDADYIYETTQLRDGAVMRPPIPVSVYKELKEDPFNIPLPSAIRKRVQGDSLEADILSLD